MLRAMKQQLWGEDDGSTHTCLAVNFTTSPPQCSVKRNGAVRLKKNDDLMMTLWGFSADMMNGAGSPVAKQLNMKSTLLPAAGTLSTIDSHTKRC